MVPIGCSAHCFKPKKTKICHWYGSEAIFIPNVWIVPSNNRRRPQPRIHFPSKLDCRIYCSNDVIDNLLSAWLCKNTIGNRHKRVSFPMTLGQIHYWCTALMLKIVKMPIADWLSYPPPLYINIWFGLRWTSLNRFTSFKADVQTR